MLPEERDLLMRSLKLAEENNEILRAIRRSMRLGRIMKIVYWVLIIGTAIGAFYFMQPYVDGLSDAYTGAKEELDSFKSMFGGGE